LEIERRISELKQKALRSCKKRSDMSTSLTRTLGSNPLRTSYESGRGKENTFKAANSFSTQAADHKYARQVNGMKKHAVHYPPLSNTCNSVSTSRNFANTSMNSSTRLPPSSGANTPFSSRKYKRVQMGTDYTQDTSVVTSTRSEFDRSFNGGTVDAKYAKAMELVHKRKFKDLGMRMANREPILE
jgi:hypothetical protein